MANKRHKPEEIVQKLRQVDVLVGQGTARMGDLLDEGEAEDGEFDQDKENDQHHKGKGQRTKEDILERNPVVIDRRLDHETRNPKRWRQKTDLGADTT